MFLICSCIVLAVCCDLNSIEDLITAELYLYVQERMLRQLLTVFTFWHGHWMQGLVFLYYFTIYITFFVFSHKLHNAIKMSMFSVLFFIIIFLICFIRTVMKSGPEIVKAGLRSFFESAADDIEKMVENLKLGKVSKGNQVIEYLKWPCTYCYP